MNINQMTEEIKHLTETFEIHKLLLQSSPLEDLLKNQEVRVFFASLYRLMQYPIFFELLLKEGFKKKQIKKESVSSKKIDWETQWSMVAPAGTIIPIFYTFLKKLMHFHKWRPIAPISIHDKLQCIEKEWQQTAAGLDVSLAHELKTTVYEDEEFLGLFEINLQTNKAGYEALFSSFSSKTGKPKKTAMVFLYDGSFVEPVFFIKDSVRTEILVGSYVHEDTKAFSEQYKIPMYEKTLGVIHDGNCAVSSQSNINTALYQSKYHYHSVYKTIDAIRSDTLILANHRLHLKDILPNETLSNAPNSPTLTRLLAKLGYLSRSIGGEGWFTFCNMRSIHPLFIIKTPFKDWNASDYPSDYRKRFGLIDGFEALIGLPKLPNNTHCPTDRDSADGQKVLIGQEALVLGTQEPIIEPPKHDLITHNDGNTKTEAEVIETFKTQEVTIRLLYNAIEKMHDYGEKIACKKGDIAITLAIALRKKLDSFLYVDMYTHQCDASVIAQFKKDFSALAQSQTNIMGQHRALWKNIVANILVALTGIGFIALIAHATILGINACAHNKSLGYHDFLFFKPCLLTLTEDIAGKGLNVMGAI